MENSDALISILSESVRAYQHRLRILLDLGLRRTIVDEIFVKFIFTRDILHLIFKVLLEIIILLIFGCWEGMFFAIEIRLSLRLFSMMLDRYNHLLFMNVVICLSVHRRLMNILCRDLIRHLLIRGLIRAARLVLIVSILNICYMLLFG